MDACAAPGSVLLTQAEALRRLGLSATPAPASWAATDPVAWLDATEAAGRVHELTDPAGLGGFLWLLQSTDGLPAEALVRA